jgi:hypothetical protein
VIPTQQQAIGGELRAPCDRVQILHELQRRISCVASLLINLVGCGLKAKQRTILLGLPHRGFKHPWMRRTYGIHAYDLALPVTIDEIA